MGIINDYNMHVYMPGDQPMVIRDILRRGKADKLTVREINENGEAFLYNLGSAARDNTEDGIIEKIKNAELVFGVSYFERNGNTEQIINRDFMLDILALREDEEDIHLLYDDFYDVKVFLQSVGEAEQRSNRYLKPVDIRKFNINNRILNRLTRLSYRFYDDAFVVRYAMCSKDLHGQYFVTKFHSNRKWELDPVNILVYRLSAFLLPGTISWEEADKIKKVKTAVNIEEGSRYFIDSIHFNSDICYDWLEFKKLLDFHYCEIGMA